MATITETEDTSPNSFTALGEMLLNWKMVISTPPIVANGLYVLDFSRHQQQLKRFQRR